VPAGQHVLGSGARRNDHLRIGRDHRLVRDDRGQLLDLAKHVPAATCGQHAVDNLAGTDRIQRSRRNLNENPDRGTISEPPPQFGKPGSECFSEWRRRIFRPGQLGDFLQCSCHLFRIPRFDHDDSVSVAPQLLHGGSRCAARPRQNQVRVQAGQRFAIYPKGISDAGQHASLCGMITVFDNAHESGSGAGIEGQFRQMGRQGDDSSRRRRSVHHGRERQQDTQEKCPGGPRRHPT